MNWKIVLNGEKIGETSAVTMTVEMPQWCNGVCYLVEKIDYKTHTITVKEHPANAGK